MWILNSSTKQVQAYTAVAPNTDLDVISSFVDISRDKRLQQGPDSFETTIDNSASDIVEAPDDNIKRDIRSISIYNSDNQSHNVTVHLNTGPAPGTNKIVFVATLLEGENLIFEWDKGWQVYDSSGLKKNNNSDYWVQHAYDVIYQDYGDIVSVEEKKKDLLKFGENLNVGTGGATIMTLQNTETAETFASGNGITTVSSSSALDTQDLVFYEGHVRIGDNLTFLRDETTTALLGQTSVSLNTAVGRINRARLSSPANGDIYFHEGGATTGGVPNDPTKTHMMIPAGEIQTQKCSTALSSIDYWIITRATVSVLEKTSSWVQARIEIKPITDTYFFPLTQWVGVTDGSGTINIMENHPFIIVPPNHDIRVFAKANTSGTYVSAGIEGILAKII